MPKQSIRSMTAYGRSTANSALGRITVEIQTVNRKFLEFHLNLPLELRRFDIDVRKWLAADLWCGQVTVTATAHFTSASPLVIVPNIPLAKQIYKAWREVASALGLEGFDWSLLAKEPGILQVDHQLELDPGVSRLLQEAVVAALSQLVEMKEKEGLQLRIDCEQRLNQIQRALEVVSEKVTGSPRKYRDKLAQRLQEVLPGCVENEERLLRELVVYAERIDVSEELTRLRSHIAQFETLLEGKPGGVGKTLDFLSQEMNREINTLAAKSTDLEVSHLVVDVKSNLAKIREQIQNVE